MSEISRAEAQNDRPDAGFTLVELLAAIGLLSFVSVILLGSLQFGLKAWERGTVHADRVDHIALVQNFLRRAIEDAYPLFPVGATPRGHVEFEGTATSLWLLSTTSHALSSGGRSRLSLTVGRGSQGLDLIVVATPELSQDQGEGTKKMLLRGIQSAELSYFATARAGHQAVWRDRWTGEARLPQLIRLRVSFPPGDARAWPELVVAPRIGADVGCIYDPLTKQCRGR
jgi:general secretion pathway protein J